MTLANPSTMAEALADPEAVREAKAKLEEAGVKYILSCWIDMLGQPKTKPVPISDFGAALRGKGPQFAVHSISFVPELGPADADQIPVPDLDTLVICPWDKTCAWMFADLWWQDKPYNLCPRSAMKRDRAQGRRPTRATRSMAGGGTRIHHHALASTASRSRPSTTIPLNPARACDRAARPSATTWNTRSTPWAFWAS